MPYWWPALLLWRNILYPEQVATKLAIQPWMRRRDRDLLPIGTRGATVYLFRQIHFAPSTMQRWTDFDAQMHRAFRKLQAAALRQVLIGTAR